MKQLFRRKKDIPVHVHVAKRVHKTVTGTQGCELSPPKQRFKEHFESMVGNIQRIYFGHIPAIP